MKSVTYSPPPDSPSTLKASLAGIREDLNRLALSGTRPPTRTSGSNGRRMGSEKFLKSNSDESTEEEEDEEEEEGPPLSSA